MGLSLPDEVADSNALTVDALLPSGSQFGSPGPRGVPIFFKGPHFVYFRLKNALKVSTSTTYYMWTI